MTRRSQRHGKRFTSGLRDMKAKRRSRVFHVELATGQTVEHTANNWGTYTSGALAFFWDEDLKVVYAPGEWTRVRAEEICTHDS